MSSIIKVMTELFAMLFVDMDGAGTVYTSGAVVEFINFLLSVPLLTIPIGLGLVATVVGFARKVKNT